MTHIYDNIHFTQHAYMKDEVENMLRISLLKHEPQDEVLFWLQELLCSGFVDSTAQVLREIYLEFYALEQPQIEEFVFMSCTKYDMQEVVKLFTKCHMSLPVFILGVSRNNKYMHTIKMYKRYSSITLQPCKYVKSRVHLQLKEALKNDDYETVHHCLDYLCQNGHTQDTLYLMCEYFKEEQPKHELSNHQCYLYSLNLLCKHTMEMTINPIQPPCISQSKDDELEPPVTMYSIDRIMIHGFSNKRTNVEYKNFNKFMDSSYRWLYYAYKTPYWKDLVTIHNGHRDHLKKQLTFKSDDDYEKFMTHALTMYDGDELKTEDKHFILPPLSKMPFDTFVDIIVKHVDNNTIRMNEKWLSYFTKYATT